MSPLDAGIHQQLPPVRQLDGAAGETAGGVVVSVRSHGRREALPADEISGLHMSPVHGTPLVGVGVVLIKEVVLPLVDGEAVGVVHPADGGCDVEGRPLAGGDMGAVLGLKVSGLLQCFACHIV